jgi:cystathionine beta-lyase
VFLSLLRPGDHVLLGETVYGPARAIALNYLGPRGIACEFYPGGHEEVAKRLRPSTRLVYLDNPGSIVYDIQDVPALARLLKGRDTLLAVDNTWGCPSLYRPLALGADLSVVAITKYLAGHSDLVMGAVAAGPRCADQLWRDAALLGQTVSPDEAYNALKGLRSAAARLAMHTAHAAEVVAWLKQQPQVKRILYPPLPEDPGHALWRRDFKGANGLLSIEFAPQIAPAAADRFIDSLRLFGIGASWGGYESLALTYPVIHGWHGGALVRLHIGLGGSSRSHRRPGAGLPCRLGLADRSPCAPRALGLGPCLVPSGRSSPPPSACAHRWRPRPGRPCIRPRPCPPFRR